MALIWTLPLCYGNFCSFFIFSTLMASLRDGRLVNSVVHKFYPALPDWQLMERNVNLTAAGR